jgi:predicted nuclease of restriction endonuclease-like (RecB) superfamily
MRKKPLYERIRQILESARTGVTRTVNTTQVVANWLIGREIVEEEQAGAKKAGYGEALLADLAKKLTSDYGTGYSATNLRWFRQYYLEYGSLLSQEIHHSVRDKSPSGSSAQTSGIHHSVRGKSDALPRKLILPTKPLFSEIGYALRGQFWKPGLLHPNLSWTHYRTLLKVEKAAARSFYEIETIQNNWSARELERQINSLLYERLALSKDKKGLMKLATKGHEVQRPIDVFKDPVVMEFLDLPAMPKLVESDLEQALINNLQAFLLELGKGFAFVSRQERITLDGDHFYIDLVFYHTLLKCRRIHGRKKSSMMSLFTKAFSLSRKAQGARELMSLYTISLVS